MQEVSTKTKWGRSNAKDAVLVRLSPWNVFLVKVQLTAGLVHTVSSMVVGNHREPIGLFTVLNAP